MATLTPVTSVSRLRSNLKEYIAGLAHSGSVLVLKHSEPVAALLPYAEYEEYVRYLEDKTDAALGRKRLQEYEQDPDAFLDAEDMFKD